MRISGPASSPPLGHTVKLMAPQFVKPYVKSNKNDVADAEAICEAVGRPNMRFVAIKTPEQQALVGFASSAAGIGVGPHGARQSDPRAAGGVWLRHSEGSPPLGAADSGDFGGCRERFIGDEPGAVCPTIGALTALGCARCRRSRRRSKPGIGRMRRASAWKRCRGSGL